MNKERNSSMTRKKVVTPPTKPLPATTPRHMRPTSVSSPISAPQALKKKVNHSAPPKTKSSQVGQSKKVAPTSLHMSLSLGPAESLGAIPMTRKSLIMESMGDKDIVRRAFKTFQNRTNGFSTDEKPTTVKHVCHLMLNTLYWGKFSYFKSVNGRHHLLLVNQRHPVIALLQREMKGNDNSHFLYCSYFYNLKSFDRILCYIRYLFGFSLSGSKPMNL